MISVDVIFREDEVEVAAAGHAGYAPRGRDIVCAGVSALLYGCYDYLRCLTQRRHGARTVKSEQDGAIWFKAERCAPDARIAVETTLAGLCLVENDFGEYVRVNVTDLTSMTNTEEGDHGKRDDA